MIFEGDNATSFMLYMIKVAEQIVSDKVDVREVIIDITPPDKESLTQRAIITDDPQLAALQVLKYYKGQGLVEIRNLLDEAICNELKTEAI